MTTTLLHESPTADLEARRIKPVLRAVDLGKAYAPGRAKQVAMDRLDRGDGLAGEADLLAQLRVGHLAGHEAQRADLVGDRAAGRRPCLPA